MKWYDMLFQPVDWAYNAIRNNALDFGRDVLNLTPTGNRIPRKGDKDYTQGGLMTSDPSDVMKTAYLITDASKPLMDNSTYSPASSGGSGSGSGTWITGNTPSAESTFMDSAEVPEEIYGEWTPYLEYLREQSEANTAFSVEQAERQNAWQRETNQLQMDFNAAEAQKNRDWQEMMSNTAHQREVADLQAAGLNPVLSATGGNGAAVTSGATASGATSSGTKGEKDNTFVLGLLNFLNNVMGYATSTATAGISAGGMIGAAGLNSAATRYAADTNAAAALASSNNSYLNTQNNPNSWAGLLRLILQMDNKNYGGWTNFSRAR